MEMMADDVNDQDGMNVTDANDRLYGGGMNAYHGFEDISKNDMDCTNNRLDSMNDCDGYCGGVNNAMNTREGMNSNNRDNSDGADDNNGNDDGG